MTGNKIVNLPNLITLSRFFLIIPFIYYFLNRRISIALIFFAVITLSDKLDGISARLMNQKTELGSGLDSFTDWTLILATFVLLAIKGYIDAFWVVLLVVPTIVNGILKIAYAKRQKVVPVTFVAQLNVGLTYVTIISILIHFRYNFYFLTAMLVFAYLTMAGYISKVSSLPKKSVRRKNSRTKTDG